MNYFSIKNIFFFNLKEYADIAKIYYIDDNNFLIMFDDLSHLSSVNLSINMFDLENTEYFETIYINIDNDSNIYTTKIKLYQEEDISKCYIPTFIKPRMKMISLKNKYN